MSDAEDLVKQLREVARTDEFGLELLLDAADVIEKQQAALESIKLNLHPENKPPDRKWVMDRAFNVARQALE